MKNLKFNKISGTPAANVEMIETLAGMKAKDRKYFQQACVSEWEEVDSVGIRPFSLRDVIKVKKILKIK